MHVVSPRTPFQGRQNSNSLSTITKSQLKSVKPASDEDNEEDEALRLSQCTTPDIMSEQEASSDEEAKASGNLTVEEVLDKKGNVCKELAVHFRRGKEPQKMTFEGFYDKYLTNT